MLVRPHSWLSIAGPSYEAAFWAELGRGGKTQGESSHFLLNSLCGLRGVGQCAQAADTRQKWAVSGKGMCRTGGEGSGSQDPAYLLTHSPACVVALTFLDGAWACGQSSALAVPWVGKAALAIVLQPTCYLCLGMEVSHIQVRSSRLRDLGRFRALSKSSQTIASLPSTGPLAVTTASWVSGEPETQLSLPQGFSRLTHGACEDMFTAIVMFKHMMSTCVGAHTQVFCNLCTLQGSARWSQYLS